MKKLVLILLSLYTLVSYGQIVYPLNGLRAGDEIVKQQVEYKDPGRDGENVIWDFSKLESINDEYTLSYTEPYLINKDTYILGKDTILSKDVSSNELIIGTEHNTMYYYCLKNNKLWLLGHENPTTLLHYDKPLLTNIYPTNYKESMVDTYHSEGLYSSRIPFQTEGQVQIEADAYGMMILPSGDTLNHVLRTKTIQSIQEAGKEKQTILETYKWYSKGYRYPVFETVRTYEKQDTIESRKFETAFYFPPQDHFYLDHDKENLAVLDSLWNIGQKPEEIPDPTQPSNQLPLTYNFYPNPVVDYLTVEYYLEQVTPVSIMIYSLEGKLVKTINKPKQNSGLLVEKIDCNSLSKGTYILNIQTNINQPTSNKIIKQ